MQKTRNHLTLPEIKDFNAFKRFDFMLKRNSLPAAKAATGFALRDDPNKDFNALGDIR